MNTFFKNLHDDFWCLGDQLSRTPFYPHLTLLKALTVWSLHQCRTVITAAIPTYQTSMNQNTQNPEAKGPC